ncbi:MAG: ABC transporter permease [Microbacteriaceae bacterium]
MSAAPTTSSSTSSPTSSATFLSGIGTIVGLELRQRVRGVAAWVLLGIFVLLVGLVTLGVWFAFGSYTQDTAGGQIFSTVIYFVLLLGTLVTPALSGNAINGDRDAGTLATTQVTLVTTWQLILGKFLAAWVTALAFLVASVPFLFVAVLTGDVRADVVLVSLLVLSLELGMVAAVGVGLSGVINKPLFSIVTTYLVVAALSVGTLITFGLAGLATQTTVDQTITEIRWPDDGSDPGANVECDAPYTASIRVPRFDLYWGILAANPYVVLADASPSTFDERSNPVDLFTTIKVGSRLAQIPRAEEVLDYCADYKASFASGDQQGSDYGYGGGDPRYSTGEKIVENTVSSGFVGLTIHVLLGAGMLVWAWARTETPARRLTKGSRIA